MLKQLLSDVVTLSPGKSSGRDGDVGGIGGVLRVQLEQQTDVLPFFSLSSAVDLYHKSILSSPDCWMSWNSPSPQ